MSADGGAWSGLRKSFEHLSTPPPGTGLPEALFRDFTSRKKRCRSTYGGEWPAGWGDSSGSTGSRASGGSASDGDGGGTSLGFTTCTGISGGRIDSRRR